MEISVAKKKSDSSKEELLRTDGHWTFGTPPTGNANFAWLPHFVFHLAPKGTAGVVLAKGALTSKTSGEGEIRKVMIADGKGFCASVPLERVAELDYVLTPGRYVGLPDEEDDFNFAERFAALRAEFEAQLEEEARLNKAIAENLSKVMLPESRNS